VSYLTLRWLSKKMLVVVQKMQGSISVHREAVGQSRTRPLNDMPD
jgi:hypothetical protein